MDRIFKANRCLGYMDLRTGAIVWGHYRLLFIFHAIVQYGIQLMKDSPVYFGRLTIRPDIVLGINGMCKNLSNYSFSSSKFEYRIKTPIFTNFILFVFNYSKLVFLLFVVILFLCGIFNVSKMILCINARACAVKKVYFVFFSFSMFLFFLSFSLSKTIVNWRI